MFDRILEGLSGLNKPVSQDSNVSPSSKVGSIRRAVSHLISREAGSKSITWIDNEQTPNQSAKQQAKPVPVSILKKGLAQEIDSSRVKTSRVSSSRMSSSSSASRERSEYREFGDKTLIAEYNAKDEALLQKYKTALEELTKHRRKFTDELFPPSVHSLLNSSKRPGIPIFLQARWVRLPEVFKGRPVFLFDPAKSVLAQRLGHGIECPVYLLRALSVLAERMQLAKRLFQQGGERPSEQGIYSVKLCHGGIWQHVTIDDYYPTIEGQPLFFSPFQERVEIWPFLLTKALAKLYGTFQAIANGTVCNSLHQLTGVLPIPLVRTEEQHYGALQKLRREDVLFVVSEQNKKVELLSKSGRDVAEFVFVVSQKGKEQAARGSIEIVDREGLISTGGRLKREGARVTLGLDWLSCYFCTIYLLKVDLNNYYVARPVRQAKGSNSLRWLTLDERSTGRLCLTQKDERLFRAGGYRYSWARLLVGLKDVDGFRYIAGGYSDSKVLSLQLELPPGEYCILVIVEWGARPFELVLSFEGSSLGLIERREAEGFELVLSELCLDLCQRFGVRRQVNANLCTYSLVHFESGLVLQNFNNENATRRITLRKSYRPGRGALRELSGVLGPGGQLDSRVEARGSLTVVFQVTEGRLRDKEVLNFDFS